MAIERRLAEGASEKDLLDAVDGARARSDAEGWANVCSAFAVVVARVTDVKAYAQRGRDFRRGHDRRRLAAREARARERATDRTAMSMREALAETIAAAAEGRYELAAQLAHRIEESDKKSYAQADDTPPLSAPSDLGVFP
jgi:hypothetical protein